MKRFSRCENESGGACLWCDNPYKLPIQPSVKKGTMPYDPCFYIGELKEGEEIEMCSTSHGAKPFRAIVLKYHAYSLLVEPLGPARDKRWIQ